MVIQYVSIALLLLGQDNDRAPKLGVYQGRTIEYVESNGMAIVEGDIVLGPVSLVNATDSLAPSKRPQASILAMTASSLWPKTTNGVAEIPYKISGNRSGVGDPLRNDLATAVSTFNTTFQGVVQFVEHGGNRKDFVNFSLMSPATEACVGSSPIGRTGTEQVVTITGSICVGTILHEMGHVAGLQHEHTRKDRGQHLSINWRTIDGTNRSQYRAALASEDVGPFDYSSIMIYDNVTFPPLDRQLPAIETIPPGIPLLKNGKKYAATDVAAVRRLYGSVDHQPVVTAVSNPPDIPLRVECGFSETVLDVPRDDANRAIYKDSSGTLWQFARWSDVVDAGPTPFADPRRIVPNGAQIYVANFVRLLPLGSNGFFSKTTVLPENAGTIRVVDPPVVIEGNKYRVADALITMEAVPAPGYIFYRWDTLASEVSANPRRVNPDTFTMPTAYFVRRIAARVETYPPGLSITVDTSNYRGSRNLTAPEGVFAFDGKSWTPDSPHVLTAPEAQLTQVEDPEAVLRFHSFSSNRSSDPPFQPGKLTTPFRANGQTLTARYVHAYPIKVATRTEQETCAIWPVVTNPPAVNLRYNEGSDVKLDLQMRPGWQFIGWDPPLENNTIKVTGTMRLTAVVNTSVQPLTFVKTEPAQVAVGSTSVEVLGSGFDSTTRYCLFASGRPLSCDIPSEVSPGRLRVALPLELTLTPGTLQMELRNGFPSSCEVRSPRLSFEIR